MCLVQIYLEKDKCCAVARLDMLGFVNEGSSGALGYEFVQSGVDNLIAPAIFNTSLLPDIGDFISNFNTLSLPYEFALAAAYDTGTPPATF